MPRIVASEPKDLTRILVQIAVFVALGLLAWSLAHLLLLVFGAIVVAAILHGAASGVERATGLQRPWSLTIAGLALLALVAATTVLLGAQIASQLGALSSQLDNTAGKLREVLDSTGALKQLKDSSILGGLIGSLPSLGGTVLTAIADVILVVIAGIYLAIDPQLYKRGTVLLFPESVRERIEAALDASGQALGQWLLAQVAAMVIIGTTAAIGLMLIGVPSALALGLIAGVTEFIPYLGPWLGAAPALLMAWSIGPYTLLWTALLYLAIQQVEAYVVAPLLAERLVSVPPVVGLFAVVAFGLTFGPIGVIMAFPLTVVTMVMVIKLYVQPELHEPVPAPGENADDADVAQSTNQA
jgi:predicted PurR-regulated permease PerM